ncbi:hypothetical protein V5F89_09400 [Pelagerythrobacter marensis]|uniref:Tetratricopeptide repeat protein n=1 Tax=Pelagerythrobacter marensis TaxID=543877 RepID=A0ABZ2D0B8_9SPHN
MKFRDIAIAALVLGAVPATAQQASEATGTARDYGAMSDAELEAALEGLGDAWIDRCEISEPLLAELSTRPAKEDYRSGMLLARMACADRQGAYERAADALAEYEKDFDPLSFLGLGFYLDSRRDDAASALARLERFANTATHETAEALNIDGLQAAATLARKHGREDAFEDLAFRLFQSPLYASVSGEVQSGIAYWALVPAIRANDEALIDEALGQIRNPTSYPDFLALREYEPAWPQIERRVGEHFTAITEAFRHWAAARYENAPHDRDRFSDAAHALYFDGRFEEAAALARKWRERPDAFDTIEEGDAWALNIEAYALDALGRIAEADAVFDRLAELPADENPWVVSFVINRGSRLVGQRRFAEGLEAARLAREVAEEHGNTYARMLVARDHVCALHELGRGEEAGADLAYLRENRVERVTLVVQALLCAGQRDEALAMLIDGIGDERTRAGVIIGLLPEEYDLFYTASLLPRPRDLLATSRELRTAYERWAREIPDTFVPAASRKRVPLDRAR